MSPYAIILMTIFMSEIAVLLIKVVKAELAGGFFAKLVGVIFMGAIILICWYGDLLHKIG
jgi:hypothetical protein